MTRRVIGHGVVTAGLGVLLLAAGGAWDESGGRSGTTRAKCPITIITVST